MSANENSLCVISIQIKIKFNNQIPAERFCNILFFKLLQVSRLHTQSEDIVHKKLKLSHKAIIVHNT